MKKAVIVVLITMALAACDKVKHPAQHPPAVKNCIDSTAMIVKTNSAVSGFRKVLVEDYTGHTCGNCPRAAEKADGMIASLQDSVVVIAVHAGTAFAPPFPPEYPDDFRTDVGADWDTYFGMSQAGLPKGGVNRASNPFPQSKDNWPGLAALSLHKPQTAVMNVTTHFDPASLYLSVFVKTKFKAAFANDVRLSVVIIEDSIVGHQKDYNPPAGAALVPPSPDERADYRFDHMLRGALNGSWGDIAKAKPIAVNDSVSNSITCYKVQNVKNTNYVSVVVFLYDDGTKEIIQVERVRIR
ncbi:MAG: Omp28-related outer membrane protein [Bacteroidia bacterium]